MDQFMENERFGLMDKTIIDSADKGHIRQGQDINLGGKKPN
jgi:hypothetical protein